MPKKTALKTERSMAQDEQESKVFSIQVSRQSKRVYVRARRLPALLAALLLVVPWILVALYYFGFMRAGRVEPSPPVSLVASGPWGKLDCYDYITDPPDAFISSDLFPQNDTIWRFNRISRDDLRAVLAGGATNETSASGNSKRQGLPPETCDRLIAGAKLEPDQTWTMPVPDNVLMSLAPDTRAALYRELVKHVDNRRQIDPFVFNRKLLDTWLAEAHLEPATIANLEKLLYPHRDRVLLADTPTLLKYVSTETEKRKLLTVLLRRATFMLKLRVDAKTDLKALSDYWGTCGRRAEVGTMLESLSYNRTNMQEDILMLLPPFARHRLYMYPLPDQNPISTRRDCHWSALNFFRDPPEDRFVDGATVLATIASDYVEIPGQPMLGDVAMFKTPTSVIHSCVYIADDFYFTKNGPSFISPWVLMRRDDIRAFFPAYEDLRIVHYRLKKN